MNARLTSFATYQDLVAFVDCIEAGGTFNKCLSKGDNGRGASGMVTAQVKTPMVALPRKQIVSKWGNVAKGWGKQVRVKCGDDKNQIAILADISPDGICDLNPAMLLAMGWPEDMELSVQGSWTWV